MVRLLLDFDADVTGIVASEKAIDGNKSKSTVLMIHSIVDHISLRGGKGERVELDTLG